MATSSLLAAGTAAAAVVFLIPVPFAGVSAIRAAHQGPCGPSPGSIDSRPCLMRTRVAGLGTASRYQRREVKEVMSWNAAQPGLRACRRRWPEVAAIEHHVSAQLGSELALEIRLK